MKENRMVINSRSKYLLSPNALAQIGFMVKGLFIILVLAGLVFLPKAVHANNEEAQETPQTFILEIRYQNPAAGQVALVWGVNGWQSLPEESRPAGTELRNGTMYTPMTLEGDRFVIRIPLPAWTTVDYGFLTTQDKDGNTVNTWEANGDTDFQTVTAETDTLVDIQTALSPAGISEAGEAPVDQLANLDIQYTSPTSGEVSLVWGVNGWTLIAEGDRPAGTVVEGNVMHTPMLKEDGIFVTRVHVAPGTVVDFGFLTTKDGRGEPVEAWEANGADDFHITVNADTAHKVQSQLTLATRRDLPSILIVGLYVLIGLLVILIVGFIFRRKSE